MARFELVADAVGGGPVAVLAGLRALRDERFDLGALVAAERFVLRAVHKAEHAGELVEEREGKAAQLLRRRLRGKRGVHVAGKVEQRGERIRRVEIVVHGFDELRAVRFQPLADRGLALRFAGRAVRQQEHEVAAAVVEPFEGGAALLDDLHAVVDGAAVVGGDHEIADRLIAVFLRHVAHGEEVAEALAHLAVVHVDVAVVHPVVREGHAVAALALGDLVLVVGEDEVLPAAVDVDRPAQIAARHGGALDVPSGAAFAPGGGPARLAGLGGLPQREVHRVLLQLAGGDARAGLQLLERLVGELAVFRIAARAEVDVAILGGVGVALLHKRFDDGEDLADVLGGERVHGGGAHVQPGGVHAVFVDVFARNREVVGAFLVRAADDLVVNVGEILHERDLHAAVFEIAAEHVEHADGAGVADVDEVVDRGAAGVNLRLARRDRHKLLFPARKGVVDFHVTLSPFSGAPQRRGRRGARFAAARRAAGCLPGAPRCGNVLSLRNISSSPSRRGKRLRRADPAPPAARPALYNRRRGGPARRPQGRPRGSGRGWRASAR